MKMKVVVAPLYQCAVRARETQTPITGGYFFMASSLSSSAAPPLALRDLACPESSSPRAVRERPTPEISLPTLLIRKAAPAAAVATTLSGSTLAGNTNVRRTAARTSAARPTRSVTASRETDAATPRHPAATCLSRCVRSSSAAVVFALTVVRRSRASAVSLEGHSCTGEAVATSSCTRFEKGAATLAAALRVAPLTLVSRALEICFTARRRTLRASEEESLIKREVESRSRAMRRNVPPLVEPSTVVSDSSGVAACAACASAPADASSRSNVALFAS
mmetsp:Transcript_19808/g.40336  ORF Transcript_19808/g.40336 Transcript_19808/m.40336 type:complete len:278 (-) Transcript_19808:367-1200(-)